MSTILGIRGGDEAEMDAVRTDGGRPTEASAGPSKAEAKARATSGSADTVERYEGPAAPGLSPAIEARRRLAGVHAAMASLRPRMMEAREKAMRELPNLLPGLKLAKLAGQVAFDLAKAKPGEAAKLAMQKGTEEGVKHILKENLGGVTKLADVVGPFKDAYGIYTKMGEYGRLVREYESLQREAQALELELDPSKKFKVATIGGRTYSRTGADGHLVSE